MERQLGKWSLELHDTKYSAPLQLQHSLRVTKATFVPTPGVSKLENFNSVSYAVKNGKEDIYDTLCFFKKGSSTNNFDVLFEKGELVQFKAHLETVKLEGHFETANQTLKKSLNTTECIVVSKLESTAKFLSVEITAAQTQIADTITMAKQQLAKETKLSTAGLLASIQEQMTSACAQVTNEIITGQDHITGQIKSIEKKLADTKGQLTKEMADTRDKLAEVISSVQEMKAATDEQARQVKDIRDQMSEVTASVKSMTDEMVKKVRQNLQTWQVENACKALKEELGPLRIRCYKLEEENNRMKELIQEQEKTEKKQKAQIEKLEENQESSS